MSDEQWYREQAVRENLASFQRFPKARRPVKKRPVFTPEQLRIAETALENVEKEKAA